MQPSLGAAVGFACCYTLTNHIQVGKVQSYNGGTGLQVRFECDFVSVELFFVTVSSLHAGVKSKCVVRACLGSHQPCAPVFSLHRGQGVFGLDLDLI